VGLAYNSKSMLSYNDFLKNDIFEEYAPVAIIDLSAIKSNVKQIKCKLKSRFCAVVKGDAYGHGLVECSRAIEPFCDYFAVGSLNEGVALRIAGITAPILCLLPVKNIARAVEYGIQFAVHSKEYLKQVDYICSSLGVSASVHIAVNSGMNRLGIDSLSELESAFNQKSLKIEGVFSHLYNPSNKLDREAQLKRFLPFCEFAKQKNVNIITHLASSSILALEEKYALDMVRVGLAIYGYNAINAHFRLKPAMKIVAPVLNERSLNKGDSLLYGSYKVKNKEEVCICAYGYINGKRAGLNSGRNNACMNLCAINGAGDYKVIMDDAFACANRINGITYEVLTAMGNNCKRVYLREKEYENYCGKI